MKARINTVLIAGAAVCAALAALPGVAAPLTCPGGGQLGDCSAWVDMNGNGRMDPLGTDERIVFAFSPTSNQLVITHPWCGGQQVVADLSSSDTLYDTASFMGLTLAITGFDGSNHPVAFSLSGYGTARLIDGDGDGCYDALEARDLAGAIHVRAGLVFADTDGDDDPDHVSLDWGLASFYGMNGECGLDPDPQIWVPMQGSQIVPSYDNMYSSGCLREGAANVPTLSEWGVLLFGLTVVAFGWWLLRRRQALA